MNSKRPNSRLSDAFDVVPPQDLEAEAAVLSSIIRDGVCAGEIAGRLPSAAFHSNAHRLIYEALLDLFHRRRGIDLVTLRDELERRGALEDAGGVVGLTDVATSVPSAANALEYAEIVRAKWLKRRLAAFGHETFLAASNGKAPEELLPEAQERLFQIVTDGLSVEEGRPLVPDLLVEAAERIDARQRGEDPNPGVKTGFATLDKMTGGLRPGNLIIIGARPSVGKTALGCSMARNFAASGTSVLFVSLEMSHEEITDRLLAIESGVDMHAMRSYMTDVHVRKLNGAVARMEGGAQVTVVAPPSLKPAQMRVLARRYAAQGRADVVIVDYLQILTPDKSGETRQVEVAELSRQCKVMARELKVPVVVLSQLNRQVETRDDRRPRLADLRESGALEQDADVVCLLHRPGYYAVQQAETLEERRAAMDDTKAELNLCKQRNGPTGVIELEWRAGVMQFTEAGLP